MDDEKDKIKDPSESSRLYRFARGCSFILSHCLFPVRYVHPERLKELKAPYILIANHQSWMDPLIVALLVPYEIRFLGKKELHKGRLAGYVMDRLRMIPVARHETDITAMRSCSRALKDGHVLGIFPEGTRHQKNMMEEVEAGASLLALRSRVPLIPVYFDAKLRFLRRTTVLVGEPIDYSDLSAEGANMTTSGLLDQRIRDRFYALRAEVRNGNAEKEQE